MARRYKWRRRQGMPEHWFRINIGGEPGDVERAAQRIVAAVRADQQAVLAITVSSLRGNADQPWHNDDFCERHRALGLRLAELDPQDRHKIAARVTPDTAAMLAGKPDEARRLALGPGADLLAPGEDVGKFNLQMVDLPTFDLNLGADNGWGFGPPSSDWDVGPSDETGSI